MVGRARLMALAAPLACAVEAPPSCDDDAQIQLVAADNHTFYAVASATDTFIGVGWITGDGVRRTFLGPGCGADARELVHGMALVPARIHADRAEDDPDLACDIESKRFFRFDPASERAPELVHPHLRCDTVLRTPVGPLIPDRQDTYWLIPDFPDDAAAVPMFTSTRVFADPLPGASDRRVVGDALTYQEPEMAIRRVDLRTRGVTLLAEDMLLIDATPTHLLLRAPVDPDIAPMSVLDTTTGARTYLGLWHAGDDDYGTDGRTYLSAGWRFTPTGAHVLQVAYDLGVPMTAYGLDGRPVEFPSWGTPALVLRDDTHVITHGAEVVAARPGEPAILLDWQYGDGTWVAKPASRPGESDAGEPYLEVLMGTDLYRVPLDGGPRTLLALDIGPDYEWLDEHHIVTRFGDALVTTRVGANVRRTHASLTGEFVLIPERGLYYNRVAEQGRATNGVWFVPPAAIRPSIGPCPFSFWCR